MLQHEVPRAFVSLFVVALGLGACGSNDDTTARAPEPPQDCPAERVTMLTEQAPWCALGEDGNARCWSNNSLDSQPPSGTYQQICGDLDTGCGLTPLGTLSCWGWLLEEPYLPPAGTFVQVSVKRDYACAVATDGSIACWGTRLAGELPAGTFTQVSVGTYQTCAIRADDASVACWGFGPSTIPGPFVQISTGPFQACGLKTDGTLTCWFYPKAPFAIPGTFTDVHVADPVSCGVNDKSSVKCWTCEFDSCTLCSGANCGGVPPAALYQQVLPTAVETCGVTVNGGVHCWNASGPTWVPENIHASKCDE